MSSQLPPGAKGRLVPPRRTKKPNRKQRRETDKENAISRGKNILGSEQWESMRAQWSNICKFLQFFGSNRTPLRASDPFVGSGPPPTVPYK